MSLSLVSAASTWLSTISRPLPVQRSERGGQRFMNRTSTPASAMSSSTSSREGDADTRLRSATLTQSSASTSTAPSRPRMVYEQYHGDDSENEVEDELRERETSLGFRASRTRPFPSPSTALVRRSSPAIMTLHASTIHAHFKDHSDVDMADDPKALSKSSSQTSNVARLPTELYGLIASFVLSERPIAKIHTFRKSPWRIVAGASVTSRAMRAAIMRAWFRVLRIRQVGDFNFIDQNMSWMFPWVREIHWHYRFPIACNETHVLPKFIHAVLISFKTSDNRLGNEHYMAMVGKAMPYLGSISTLTRLSLTCRSLFDPKFLISLAQCWPTLECLRLARPLKEESDMKAFILYRYEFGSYVDVIMRLVSSLRNLRHLAYIAIDLSFADYRLMRTTHTQNGPAPVLPRYITLPKSLRPPQPSPPGSPAAMDAEGDGDGGGSGSETDADGDTVMDDATIVGGPLALTSSMAALQVNSPAPTSSNPYAHHHQAALTLAGMIHAANLPPSPLPSSAPPHVLYPTSHNPSTQNCLECPFCLRAFRGHSYFIEHEVALGLARGLPSLAAVRFRASFPNPGTQDAKENKWLIKRSFNGVDEEELVTVCAPRWD